MADLVCRIGRGRRYLAWLGFAFSLCLNAALLLSSTCTHLRRAGAALQDFSCWQKRGKCLQKSSSLDTPGRIDLASTHQPGKDTGSATTACCQKGEGFGFRSFILAPGSHTCWATTAFCYLVVGTWKMSPHGSPC